MELDLTRGSVLKNVVRFSLPYLLSYFLQTLYGMADLFIIGQYAGVEATTAVSVGSQVMHMLTVMIVWLAMGTTVSIAQTVGARDHARAAVGTDRTDRKRALPPVLDRPDAAHHGLQRTGTADHPACAAAGRGAGLSRQGRRERVGGASAGGKLFTV